MTLRIKARVETDNPRTAVTDETCRKANSLLNVYSASVRGESGYIQLGVQPD